MLRNIFRDLYSWTFVTPTFLALACIVHFSSCSHSPENEYPVVSLPPDADTTSPVWKGIDLEPKPPVKAKSPAEKWNQPVATGDCDDANNHFKFRTAQGRFLRIVQTAKMEDDAPWKMEDLKILGSPVVDHG